MKKIGIVLAMVLSCQLLAPAGLSAASPQTYQLPDAAGYALIVGTWESRDGREMHISQTTIDGKPYTLYNVTSDGWNTVVRFTVGGVLLSLTFPSVNTNYTMLNNMTSGRFADTADFVRKYSFSH